jgi:L-cysteine S-thiosulfotransferase
MLKKIKLLVLSGVIGSVGAYADPAKDLENFQGYFAKKFPNVEKADFSNGVYAIDQASREQWEAIEEFPPYEEYVEKGKEMWEKKFKNGKTYASCFKGMKTDEIRPAFPRYNSKTKRVETLELMLNECREKNKEKPLKWKRGPLAHLSAFLAYEARGQKINVKLDSKGAKEAYSKGRHFFYAKRGQLNLACADCHVNSAGLKVRADLLSPALGHTTHFPVFRAKWSGADKNGDGLGTLHRRYGGCNKQVRAKPFKPQSEEYRNLELFHAYMSNGLEINGPGYRK